MTGQRWKRAEREIAAALGTRRLPNIGRGQPDCRAAGVAYQIKTTKALPAWLTAAMAQATRDAVPGELPAVVLNQVAQGRRAVRLVVLPLEAWCALIAGGGTAQNCTEYGPLAGAAMPRNVPENDPSRAPPATPAATMAMQHTRTPAGTMGAGHRGDPTKDPTTESRPPERPTSPRLIQNRNHNTPAAAPTPSGDQTGTEGGPRWRPNRTRPDTRPMA